ncbi:MAG TPA: hypothetical protein VG125_15515 [Pirellulales bacterium]|jgi:hypothetical protein|nr:hypothetical protein [Pirellulales bacterium]
MAEDQAHTAEPPGNIAAEATVTPVSPPGYELLDKIGHVGVVYRARDLCPRSRRRRQAARGALPGRLTGRPALPQ